jgi:hypothetical protein
MSEYFERGSPLSFIHTTPLPLWRLLAKASVLIVLMVSLLYAQPVSAAIRTCRTDPIFLLSNGGFIQTDVVIETDAANVLEVRYQLHVPRGVKVLLFPVHTPSSLWHKEVVEVFDDMPPYQYATVTTIRTTMPNIRWEANTRTLLGSGSAIGYSGQSLTINIRPLTLPLGSLLNLL